MTAGGDGWREAARTQDIAVAARGLTLWVGAEPTFTLRSSQDPAWLTAAEGADKAERARALLLSLAPRLSPAPVLFRSAGRRYPGEKRPRFCYGALFKRDRTKVWDGPPDPLIAPLAPPPRCAPEALREALAFELKRRGAAVAAAPGHTGELRLAARLSGEAVDLTDPHLLRHGAHAPGDEGPAWDAAGAAGLLIFGFRVAPEALAIEFPGFPGAHDFLEFLPSLAAASARLGLRSLILEGFAPPASEALAWLTVTPDPAVVEVNLAPAPNLATFAEFSEAVFASAAAAGLSPERYRFNGQVADSGGGGQLTFGGPSPAKSPFFLHPHLLPGLVRAVNRHPSLSYAFATECLGSSSQGPRSDEGVRERFEELAVALDRLDAGASSPEALGAALAPLLVDSAGNSHRAELNVEKLWNLSLPGRGTSGLVELRALRMQSCPEQQIAIAALFRALLARLSIDPYREPLVDWGSSLHDRFALPHFLAEDLAEVLADLAAHGLGLGPFEELLTAAPEPLAEVELEGARLELLPALEFWPLIGDVASQEQRGARCFDASTARVQVSVLAPPGEDPGRVGAAGYEIALSPVEHRRRPLWGSLHLAGLRYRAFRASPGLHPGLPPNDPLRISWSRRGAHAEVALHGWRPGGGAYGGLPADAREAARRRAERAVVLRPGAAAPLRPVPASLRSPFCVDLRRLSRKPGVSP